MTEQQRRDEQGTPTMQGCAAILLPPLDLDGLPDELSVEVPIVALPAGIIGSATIKLTKAADENGDRQLRISGGFSWFNDEAKVE